MTSKKSLVTREEAGVGNSRRREEVASHGRTAQTTSHRKRKAMDRLVMKRARKVRVEEVEEDHSHVDEGAKDIEFDVEKSESSEDGETSKEDHDGDGDHNESSSSEKDGDGNDDRESDGKGDGNDDRDSEKIDKNDRGKRVIAKTVSAIDKIVSTKSSELVWGKKFRGKTISARTISATVASDKKDVAKKGHDKKKSKEQSDHRAPRNDLRLDHDFSDDRDPRDDQCDYDDGQTDWSREDDQDQTDDQFSDDDCQALVDVIHQGLVDVVHQGLVDVFTRD
ncbi:hypothetical protein Sjap_015196 [Stephania japonica]|uniref:Uncharacterized protein n=1 Tax=Stephania japonica TaxID=461633 RepID=A0AAP0IIN8_9MAGN